MSRSTFRNQTANQGRAACLIIFVAAAGMCLTGCSKQTEVHAADTGPHDAVVEPDMDANNFKVDHPDQFPVAEAGSYLASTDLNATGVVSPDVSRQIPVPSLASGRVVEINARLGDTRKKRSASFQGQKYRYCRRLLRLSQGDQERRTD